MRTHFTFTRILLVLVLLIGFGIASYATYTYLIEKPPRFLIKLVTKQKPPPPLPLGDLAPLNVPNGFVATIFSRETPGARVMTRDGSGAILVSLTKSGKIIVLTDTNADGRAEVPITVLENLKQPHGVLVRCAPVVGMSEMGSGPCILYVAETDALKSYAYDAVAHTAKYIATLTTFPSGDGHFTRTLLMHPDNKRLLISIGSSCNVCDEEDSKRATIMAFDLTTNKEIIFATGLRNSVFMAMHPKTREIWATENGRDMIGDGIPPDEINIISEGKSYGWPWCYGKNVHDDRFDKKRYARGPCADSEPSHIDLVAHSAALGLAFIPAEGWSKEFAGDLLVAYHGSWNRSVPTGYKVVRFDLDEMGIVQNTTPVDFVTGFLAPNTPVGDALGRPADILAESNGEIYLSDDRAGAIYRITQQGASSTPVE